MGESEFETENLDVYRVLALDDEYPVLDVIESQLDPLGIEVIRANTAEEAITTLRERYVDAAIVDLQLENAAQGGREVLRAMRALAPNAATVIATRFTENLGQYVGITEPRLIKIVHKAYKMRKDWAEDALRNPYEQWRSSKVRVANLELAVERLGSRGTRLAALREGEELAVEIERLLRRLFGSVSNDASAEPTEMTIELRPIRSEGLSPAVTLQANVSFGHDQAKRPMAGTPVVLKISSRRNTLAEVARYHRFVKYGVPLLHRVDMLGEGVDGALGAVSYSFAGGLGGKTLRSLDEELCRPERLGLVRKVMDELFGTPARSWYLVTGRRVSATSYFAETYETDLEDCHSQLEQACQTVARRFAPHVSFSPSRNDSEHEVDAELSAGHAKLRLPPRTLWGRGLFLEGLSTCLVHGDMHGGNVMLELAGEDLERVCLIDYGNAGPGPRLTDFVALEASARLRDAQAILSEMGVAAEGELDEALHRRAVMAAAARLSEERAVLALAWGDSQSGVVPQSPWASTVMHLSLLAHANFDRLRESDYAAIALSCAYRHVGFHVTNLVRVRFAAWIAAVYERLENAT